MKKLFFWSILINTIISTANAQMLLKYTIKENNVMGTWMGETSYYTNSLTSNIYYLDLGLSTMVWKNLETGFGLGIGTSNAVCVTANIPLKDDEIREQTPVFPYYAQIKYHFNPDKTHLFIEGNIGGILSGANGAHGTINPFRLFHGVNVGGELMIPNSDFKLIISAGIRTQLTTIDNMEYEYDFTFNRYSYSSYKPMKSSFPAIVVSAGITF